MTEICDLLLNPILEVTPKSDRKLTPLTTSIHISFLDVKTWSCESCEYQETLSTLPNTGYPPWNASAIS